MTVFPRQQTGTAGPTQGIVHIGTIEKQTFLSNTVDIGRTANLGAV